MRRFTAAALGGLVLAAFIAVDSATLALAEVRSESAAVSTVTGRVQDALTGQPVGTPWQSYSIAAYNLSGWTLIEQDALGTFSSNSPTDYQPVQADGTYRLSLPPGTYILEFHAANQEYHETNWLRPGDPRNLEPLCGNPSGCAYTPLTVDGAQPVGGIDFAVSPATAWSIQVGKVATQWSRFRQGWRLISNFAVVGYAPTSGIGAGDSLNIETRDDRGRVIATDRLDKGLHGTWASYGSEGLCGRNSNGSGKQTHKVRSITVVVWAASEPGRQFVSPVMPVDSTVCPRKPARPKR